jgi:hypothetical protein
MANAIVVDIPFQQKIISALIVAGNLEFKVTKTKKKPHNKVVGFHSNHKSKLLLQHHLHRQTRTLQHIL